MKRRISFMLVLAMMFSMLAACGGGSDAEANTPPADTGADASDAADTGDTGDAGKSYKIALSLSYRADFFSYMEAASKEVAEANNVEFYTLDANNDVQAQIQQVETCEADGYDAMIVNLVNSDVTQEILEAAGDMPVVFVNRYPDDKLLEANKYVYVGSQEEQAGQLQADYIEANFGDKKDDLRVAMLVGVLGIPTQVLRTNSVKEGLENAGFNVTYVMEEAADWERAKAMDKISQFLGTGEACDVVIANNDDMALGALEAMRNAGVSIPIVSIDANPEARAAIKNDEMAASVFQDAAGQGRDSMQCAIDLLEGKDVEVFNWIPFQLVTKDNVADFD